MSQYRGTTPTHIYEVDKDLRTIEVLFLTYKQGDDCNERTVLEKTLADFTITEDTVTTKLTQEETLAFCPDEKVRMQFRGKFPNGDAVACNKMYTDFEHILKGGVI